MKLRHYTEKDLRPIVQLFRTVFADSEGESEGEAIGRLAENLLETTAKRDLFNFVADDGGDLIGSIFLTRLGFEDALEAFLLAPVAVQTAHQGQGVGQALIGHGLKVLQDQGVSVAMTYGDPSFYAKVGFRAVSPDAIQAPFALSQPEGWLGQSLVGNPIETLSGRVTCVEALRNARYW